MTFISSEREISLPGSSLVCFQCSFDLSLYDDRLFSEMNVSLPSCVAKSVKRRKAEFLAGRHAATKLLLLLGCQDTQVGISESRAPLWPTAVVASISHTSMRAICAGASNEFVRSAGIDIEEHIAPDKLDIVETNVISPCEMSFCDERSIRKDIFLTLIYSAKESLFKALFPHVKRFFGFEAARLVSIDINDNSIVLELTENLAEEFPAGHRIKGAFLIEEHHVLTYFEVLT